MSHASLKARPEPGTPLCRLDQMEADLGSHRVTWHEWDGARRVMVIRRGDQVFAYINECPHALVHLDHPPGNLFSADRKYLQCSFHGARFRIDDGYCIAGPCQGRSLRDFPISLADGIVSVAERPASKETAAGTRR